jgi:hypothetical protein
MNWVSRTVRQARVHALMAMTCGLLGACVSGGIGRHAKGSVVEDTDDTGGDGTYVIVKNQSGQRVTVFISQGTEIWRIGDVEAYSRSTLSLGVAGTALRDRPSFLIARRLAGSQLRSETFTVGADAGRPVWTIQSYAPSSYVSLR